MRIPFLIGAALALSGAATAQTQTGGSSSQTPDGRGVQAGTYGSGTSGDGGVGVSGGGSAMAADGGTASTDSSARFNTENNTARQRSRAAATDADERARSTTTTRVRRDGEVVSRSRSFYKERGEKPVIDRQRTSTAPK